MILKATPFIHEYIQSSKLKPKCIIISYQKLISYKKNIYLFQIVEGGDGLAQRPRLERWLTVCHTLVTHTNTL